MLLDIKCLIQKYIPNKADVWQTINSVIEITDKWTTMKSCPSVILLQYMNMISIIWSNNKYSTLNIDCYCKFNITSLQAGYCPLDMTLQLISISVHLTNFTFLNPLLFLHNFLGPKEAALRTLKITILLHYHISQNCLARQIFKRRQTKCLILNLRLTQFISRCSIRQAQG